MRNQDLTLPPANAGGDASQHHRPAPTTQRTPAAQPSTDDLKGIAASMLDGLLYGAGDAVIGIQPGNSDSLPVLAQLNVMLDDIIQRFAIPTQSCILTM